MSAVADKVKAIIVEKLGVEESQVVNEASFSNDLGAENISTVGDAIAFIEKNVK